MFCYFNANNILNLSNQSRRSSSLHKKKTTFKIAKAIATNINLLPAIHQRDNPLHVYEILLPSSSSQDFRVPIPLRKQSQCFDREDILVVGIRNHAIPQAIISPPYSIQPIEKRGKKQSHQDLLNTPSIASCSHSPFLPCLDMIIFTAFSTAPLSGHFASINPIIAQHVCTTWLFSCGV